MANDRPVVAILGQSAGFLPGQQDTVLEAARDRLKADGGGWSDIIAAGPLQAEFYAWLNGRFERRVPGKAMLAITESHLSAVFTSSFDPTLRTMLESGGRQPEAILVGDPPPPVSRSKLKPKFYYLFGMTGAGMFEPPHSRLELNVRRAKHVTPMLNLVLETATPLGIVVIDGYRADSDWLRPEEIIGAVGLAPIESVLWFGSEPGFSGPDAETFEELIRRGVILRDKRPLGLALSEAVASGAVAPIHSWSEPGIVSLADGRQLVTSPTMRLSTEATASIVDDTWTDDLYPLDGPQRYESFAAFHSTPTSNRLLFEGVRRGYAIERDFESELASITRRAIGHHSNEKGAIVLSGQSGIGKSIALSRLAGEVRDRRSAAVLYAKDRVPSPAELGAFLSDVDRLDGVTLLIVDALEQPRRYDVLLDSFRSRGHRIVVVGSSYGFDPKGPRQHEGRLVAAPPTLSESESGALLALAKDYFPETDLDDRALKSEHALAQFFWQLPHSRARLGLGLGREARFTEVELRQRGRTKRPSKIIGSFGLALQKAGYSAPVVTVFDDEDVAEEQDQAASRAIDYIMVCFRLYRWVPVNLVLRAIVAEELHGASTISVDLIRDLFDGHDLFRWRYDDRSEGHLLVGGRLQIEAQLICDGRLGGPRFEVGRILGLIKNATRSGPEGAEETRFVADIVYALGPDGPVAERYRESYYEIAATLTELRKERGVRNARLMLQEATLRRHYIRTKEADIFDDEVSKVLDEARAAVDEALADITRRDRPGLRAARRTEENLWVERAATYGFLASSTARRGGSAERVWSAYLAAREAVRNATGKVDSYFPQDISLWLPLDILEHAKDLGLERTAELRADVLNSIDMVRDDELDPVEREKFERQRLRAGGVLDSPDIGDDAFRNLEEMGSTAGFFFRARTMAPSRASVDGPLTRSQVDDARRAATFLMRNRSRLSADPRCLRLLLYSFWAWKTGTWLFDGIRQPLPISEADRREISEVLADFGFAVGHDFQPRFRYLQAVFTWLIGDETQALQEFRRLARDTEYVEGKRVLPRHVIADQYGVPVLFGGVVQRRIGQQRWSIRIRELARSVDLVSGRWPGRVEVGTEVRELVVAFNYIGPIAIRAN